MTSATTLSLAGTEPRFLAPLRGGFARDAERSEENPTATVRL
jgi:hypothetical protein